MDKKNKDFSLTPSVDNTSKGITKKGTYVEGVVARQIKTKFFYKSQCYS